MTFFTNSIHNLSTAIHALGLPFGTASAAAPSTGSAQSATNPYLPTVSDVLAIRKVLSVALPIEIVDTVIDYAEYWPCTRVSAGRPGDPISAIGTSSNFKNRFLLRSYPLGYVPKGEDPTDVPFNSQDYLTTPPTPSVEFVEAHSDLTNIILNRWSEKFQVRGDFCCRKIVFKIKSHDQGWGGEPGTRGTYRCSFSWFDVGKEKICALEEPKESNQTCHFRVDHPEAEQMGNEIGASIICMGQTTSPETISRQVTADCAAEVSEARSTIYSFNNPLNPNGLCLQSNIVADSHFKEFNITWSWDDDIDPSSLEGDLLEINHGRGRETGTGQFVRNMKIGDVVTVWAKARFPGWENVVERVEIELYWAV